MRFIITAMHYIAITAGELQQELLGNLLPNLKTACADMSTDQHIDTRRISAQTGHRLNSLCRDPPDSATPAGVGYTYHTIGNIR